jgi:hypothetical protein
VLGTIYALIGIKSRLIQIFLSSAFLASVATTVLIDYVMVVPISNAVQGGFLVAVFMTGAVFGGGSLIFKEITEAFAGLLGGFCFSMWLLVFKSGGLITNSAGKGIFIGALCIVGWILAWISYTRPYALMGATAFSGSTALVLGIDCFSRAGLKEFWFYIWDLNANLFPLQTFTYPVTKGIRVEIAVVVIGTIIGVLSQSRLWKVIRHKQQIEELVQQDDRQQRDAVEEALGRQLERQNERDKLEWEMQYGNRPRSKRTTVLWQNAHPEKRRATVSIAAVDATPPTSSSESLEMEAFAPERTHSGYVHASKSKRQSAITVDAIPEVEEDVIDASANAERQKALAALEEEEEEDVFSDERKINDESSKAMDTLSLMDEQEHTQSPDQLRSLTEEPVMHDVNTPRRRSRKSLSGLTKRLTPGYSAVASVSQEKLIGLERPISRASSAAATLDVDNEELDLKDLEADGEVRGLFPPDIVVSLVASDPNDPSGTVSNSLGSPIIRQSTPSAILSDGPEEEPLLEDLDFRSPGDNAASAREPAKTPTTDETRDQTEQGTNSHCRSQASEATNSSLDTLTKTALAQVPSQLSNIVLSYRTNEWAKHIASAETPIYDEPDTVDGVREELPTRVIPPTTGIGREPFVEGDAVEMMPARTAPLSVRAGISGVGVAHDRASVQRSLSHEARRRDTAPASLAQSAKMAGKRSIRHSSNPTSGAPLAITPIEEGVPAEFQALKSADHRPPWGSPSYVVPHRYSSAPLLSSGALRPYGSQGSASPYSGSIYGQSQVNGSVGPQAYIPTPDLGTRLDSYNSRQPQQRDHRKDADRRVSMLAEWRVSQQQQVARESDDVGAVDAGRTKMKMAKDHQKMWEQYQRDEQQRKQQAMDRIMRRPDMQELHREAMRKMQANAYARLRSSTG